MRKLFKILQNFRKQVDQIAKAINNASNTNDELMISVGDWNIDSNDLVCGIFLVFLNAFFFFLFPNNRKMVNFYI